MSDSDLHSLLEAKTAYAALTSFGPVIERNAQSAVIENQLRHVWLHGKSLAERIQTRLYVSFVFWHFKLAWWATLCVFGTGVGLSVWAILQILNTRHEK